MDINKFIEKYKKKISKREEDIKDFKESHNPELIHAIPIYERENAEYKVVIDALEKQIPIKVAIDDDTEFTCPTCGKITEDYDVTSLKFCPECGQKLRWD
jgi:rubrerythrin